MSHFVNLSAMSQCGLGALLSNRRDRNQRKRISFFIAVKTDSLTVAALQRDEPTEPRASSTPGDERKSCTGEHRLEEHRTGGA